MFPWPNESNQKLTAAFVIPVKVQDRTYESRASEADAVTQGVGDTIELARAQKKCRPATPLLCTLRFALCLS